MMFARQVMPYDEEEMFEIVKTQVAETLPHLDVKEYVFRETFHQSAYHADPTIFVVEEDRHVIGYLMALVNGYAFTDGVFTVQEVLYVRPDRRGTRAAALLVKMFVEWSERLGAREIIFGIANGFQPDRTAKFFELTAGAKRVGYYLKRVR